MGGFILVDGNSRGHAHHNSAILSTPSGFQTQAIFGFIKEMRNLKSSYPDRRLIVLWDGRAQWRFDIYPGYKENRVAKTPAEEAEGYHYRNQTPIIRSLLQALNIEQKLNVALEADDLAGYLAPKLEKFGPVLLVTGDGDWKQLVSPQVTWHDPRKSGITVDHSNFFEMTGYKTPANFLVGKAMMGDSSDCITGVGGFGEKKAPLFVAEFGDLPSFIRMVKNKQFTPKLKMHKDLLSIDAVQRYIRNVKLMDLTSVPVPDPADAFSLTSEYDEEKFRSTLQELGFVSILKDIQNFLLPFRQGQLKL